MATAMPSSRWGPRAGWSSASCWKSCLTDVAESWNSATPSVNRARLPISTTRAMCSSRLAAGRLLLERLEHLRWRHRQLGEADAGGVLHRVGDGAERRDDGGLADAAHAVGVTWVGDFDHDRVDLRDVRRDGHA